MHEISPDLTKLSILWLLYLYYDCS